VSHRVGVIVPDWSDKRSARPLFTELAGPEPIPARLAWFDSTVPAVITLIQVADF